MIRVERVTSPLGFLRFLRLPARLYSADSAWVPPLTVQTMLSIGYPWAVGTSLFLARSGKQVVGRIGVKRHLYQGADRLHFGFFECLEDYPEAAIDLFQAARAVAPDLPLVGPFNFRMEDPYTGLLVQGFDREPYFWSAFNSPHYEEMFEHCGLVKEMDLFSYELTWETLISSAVERAGSLARARGVRIRPLCKKNRWSDIRQVASVMNSALQGNWGFEPFSESDVRELGLLSYLFLDTDWLMLAELDDTLIGACIVLPNFNPWLRESKGHLSLGLLQKLLYQQHSLTSIRGWALAALPEYKKLGAGPALISSCLERARATGVERAEIAWILEENKAMNKLICSLGGRLSRVHRIYRQDACN